MKTLFFLLNALLLFTQYSQARVDTVLFIRSQFSDKAFPASDAAWLNHLQDIHAKNQEYWFRNSYRTLTELDVTYTSVLTLDKTQGFYQGIRDTQGSDPATFAFGDDARAAAQSAGYAVSNFDHVVHSYPSIGIIAGGAVATPGNVWLPNLLPFTGLIHEFGHSLGAGHASSIEGSPDTITYPGSSREGRDGLYMMGSEGGILTTQRGPINPPMRQIMGFLPAQYTQEATQSAVYRIWDQDIATLPSAPLNIAVRVKAAGETFWLSYSPQMTQRWADYDSEGFETGIIVHLVPANSTATRILDFTPGSFVTNNDNEKDYKDTRDGALTIGNSYQFPGSSIAIEPLVTGTQNGIKYIDVKISGIVSSNFAYEPFDYNANAQLNGLNGGSGWPGAWNQTSTNGVARINSSGLTYPGLTTQGRSLNLQTSTDTPSLTIERNTNATFGTTGEETWTSFLFRANKRERGHFFLNTNNLPVGKNWPTRISINNTTTSTDVQEGVTYLIVTRSVNQNGNDRVHLWINPSTNTQPADSTASLFDTSKDMGEGGKITIDNSGYGQGNYDLDEIRVGKSWQAVSAWTEDLSNIASNLGLEPPSIDALNTGPGGSPQPKVSFRLSPNFIYSIERSSNMEAWFPVPNQTHIETSSERIFTYTPPLGPGDLRRFWRINRQALISRSE